MFFFCLFFFLTCLTVPKSAYLVRYMIRSSTYLVLSIIVHKRPQILQVRFFNFPRCLSRWRNFHLTGESSKDWVHFALVHPLIGFKTRANLLARPIRRTLKTIAHSPLAFSRPSRSLRACSLSSHWLSAISSLNLLLLANVITLTWVLKHSTKMCPMRPWIYFSLPMELTA